MQLGGGQRASCWRGGLGASQGQLQELTARAKTPVLSPSEVYTLSTGQAFSTLRSICSAGSAVPVEDMITPHMAVAALWGQSSVSGGSGPQHCGLGCCRGPRWPSALPLPTGPRWQHPASPRGCRHLEGQGGSVAARSGADMAALANGGARGSWNCPPVWQSPGTGSTG